MRAIKRAISVLFVPVIFAGLCWHFAWYAVHGPRVGSLAREAKAVEISAARIELARVEAERDSMERRVAGLRGDLIDRDQLDERARALLNMVGKDEIVAPYGPGKQLF
ncbi:FtsB family cell division protein [Roseomonas marmotae]|uniref:Septum formation initiator family protein n=1 Tax=Roseomonas marmotae TaxID=2768161 RepID=A0ABS3KBJ6_9PROT|nr:septum formation initiator family protein [Roseomonas marmotae]MBO1074300.1 septum formation initiator family protein [Roseomonas marmotae]QTI78054.1 septum formation initiator family protein [Roseomonas marmotae]